MTDTKGLSIGSTCGIFSLRVGAAPGSEESITPWIRAGHVCLEITDEDGDMMLPRLSPDRAEWLAAQLTQAAAEVRRSGG